MMTKKKQLEKQALWANLNKKYFYNENKGHYLKDCYLVQKRKRKKEKLLEEAKQA